MYNLVYIGDYNQFNKTFYDYNKLRKVKLEEEK